MLHVAVSKDIN